MAGSCSESCFQYCDHNNFQRQIAEQNKLAPVISRGLSCKTVTFESSLALNLNAELQFDVKQIAL